MGDKLGATLQEPNLPAVAEGIYRYDCVRACITNWITLGSIQSSLPHLAYLVSHVSVYLSLFYLSSGFMYTASATPDGRSFRISFSTAQHTRQRRKEVHDTCSTEYSSTGIAALKTLDNLSEVGGEEKKNPLMS